MPSIRYDEPSGTTNCWPARATSGSATQTACPSASGPSLKPVHASSQDRTCLPDTLGPPPPRRQRPSSGDGISGQPTVGYPRRRNTPLGRHFALVPEQIANGLIEEINSLIQAAKAKARGCRSIRNLTAIVYLLAGKLDLSLPS